MIAVHQQHALPTRTNERQIDARRASVRAQWSASERRHRSLQAATALQALWSLISRNGVEGH